MPRLEQILVLAFNNHAAKELEERINERLAGILNGSSVKVKTFHALGLEIIAEVENAKPAVPDFAGDSGGGRKLIDDLIQHLIATDRIFATEWALFRAVNSSVLRKTRRNLQVSMTGTRC